MNTRTTGHEVRVGLVVIVGLIGLGALFGLASGGPGFLSTRRYIEVDFKDGQGIRPGSTVRIAGLDVGRVADVNLAESDGTLKARVKIAIPVELAQKLKQDLKITIQASLTGQARLNIVSTGRSNVALVQGQVVEGVESSFFDPIIEQVGLGPEQRKDLAHMIGEIRQTVDATTPRVRAIMASLADVAAGVKETSESVRPSLESTASHIEEMTRKIAAATPKIEASLAKLEALTTQADGLIGENRPNIAEILATTKDITATLKTAIVRDQDKFEKILVNLDGTRARVDRVLYQVDQIADQGLQMVVKNRANVERTVSNVRDATDWADKLVQKIFANPFVLSPLYKPTPEDVRVQVVYDTAQVFAKGSKELYDAVKTLDAMNAKPLNAQQREDVEAVRRQVFAVTTRLEQMSGQLSEAMRPQPGRRGPVR